MTRAIWLKGSDRIPSLVQVVEENEYGWISGRSKVKMKLWFKSEFREISEEEVRELRRMEKLRGALERKIHKECTHEELRKIAYLIGLPA